MQNYQEFQMISYNQQEALVKSVTESIAKYEEFKERLKPFENVETLEEAKELGKQILPVANEFNTFRVGKAVCTVINRDDSFRICVDSAEEFISYDFA